MANVRTDVCSKCGTMKKRFASGRSRCLPCSRANGRRYYRTNAARRAKERDSHFRRKYGIGLATLKALLAAQGSCCAICLRPWQECRRAKVSRYETSSSFFHHLYVDHDHATGAVRGLLCNACNTALGLFEDRCDSLLNAIRYLERFSHKCLATADLSAGLQETVLRMDSDPT